MIQETLNAAQSTVMLNSMLIFGIVAFAIAIALYFLKFATRAIVAAAVIGVLFLLLGVYKLGIEQSNQAWSVKLAEANAKIEVVQEQSRLISKAVEVRVVKEVEVVRQTRVVYRDRVKKIAVKINNQCKIAPEVNEILNAAALTPDLSILKEKIE